MTYRFKLARRLAVLFGVAALVLAALWYAPFVGSLLANLPHPILRWIVAAVGSAAGQIFAFQKGFAGAEVWLRKTFPNRSPVFYTRVNFCLSSVVGAVLGVLVMQPSDLRASLTAGLCWPLLIQRGVDQSQDSNPSDKE